MRKIVHLDADSFMVSIERQQRGLSSQQPIIVATNYHHNDFVLGCSHELKALGIYPSQEIRHAERLCPEAPIIEGNPTQYHRISQAIYTYLFPHAPAVELNSVDDYYLDMSTMPLRVPHLSTWSTNLRDSLHKEFGLSFSVGIAPNKLTAKIAANLYKPAGLVILPYNGIESLFRRLPVQYLPSLARTEICELSYLGVFTCTTLRSIPVSLLRKVLGAKALPVHQHAAGIDYSPVTPPKQNPIIKITRTARVHFFNMPYYESLLHDAVAALSYLLRNKKTCASVFRVRLIYRDHRSSERVCRTVRTNYEQPMQNLLRKLFYRIYTRRVNLHKIEITAENLSATDDIVTPLYYEHMKHTEQLYAAIDSVRHRYGRNALRWGI